MSDEIVNRTPIYDVAAQTGATFAQAAGWQVVDAFDGVEVALAQDAIGLADRSARARVLVEGANAMALIERAWGVSQFPINGGAAIERGAIFCLRPDRFLLSGPPGSRQAFVAESEDAVHDEDGLVAVTDVTHGRAELWLIGHLAPDLLSRLCGLDLHPQVFPNLTARETSVAKTAQLVIRRDVGGMPVYAIAGARSFGAYLWRTIVAAAHDIPLQLCGERNLRALENKEPYASS